MTIGKIVFCLSWLTLGARAVTINGPAVFSYRRLPLISTGYKSGVLTGHVRADGEHFSSEEKVKKAKSIDK